MTSPKKYSIIYLIIKGVREMRIVFCDDDISVMEKLKKHLRTFYG